MTHTSTQPTTLPQIQKILQIHSSPATLTPHELNQIHSYLATSTTISSSFPLWSLLRPSHRLHLCRYATFLREYRHENEGHMMMYNNNNSAPNATASSSLSDALFHVVLRGCATVSFGERIVKFCRAGSCFGFLNLPSNLQYLTNRKREEQQRRRRRRRRTTDCNKTVDKRPTMMGCKTTPDDDDDDEWMTSASPLKIKRETGSCYIIFSSRDCAAYLNKLSEKLSMMTILTRLELKFLYHYGGDHKGCQLCTIPRRRVLLKEGMGLGYVFLIVRGSCAVLRKKEQEKDGDGHCRPLDIIESRRRRSMTSVMNTKIREPSFSSSSAVNSSYECLSMVGPMSFVGLHPLLLPSSSHPQQPYTVVASSKVVSAIVFPVKLFEDLFHLKPDVKGIFEEIIGRQEKQQQQQKQQQIRMMMVHNKPDMNQIQHKKPSNKSNSNNDDKNDERDLQPLAPITTSSQSSSSSSNFIERFELMLRHRVKKHPKLQKHKFLQEFKRLILGQEKEFEWIEYDEPSDPFERFDFIIGKNNNDNDEDDGGDGLLWYPPPNEEEDVGIYYFAGDDFDYFVKPFPSIVRDRKRHGKTLPIVGFSEGYLDPFRQQKIKRTKMRVAD